MKWLLLTDGKEIILHRHTQNGHRSRIDRTMAIFRAVCHDIPARHRPRSFLELADRILVARAETPMAISARIGFRTNDRETGRLLRRPTQHAFATLGVPRANTG